MLIILSDIHLTDESTAVNVSPDAFRNILNAEILSKSLNEINIVLLGDIFDVVRTDYWMGINRNERPWNGRLNKLTAMNQHPGIENHYKEVLNRILSSVSAEKFITMLNNLKRNSSVHVKITYVTGNHDRAFNNFSSLQDMVRNKMGAFNSDEIVFTTRFASEEYASICRHGHEYDDSNYGWELYKTMTDDKSISRFDEKIYKVQSIGEVITAELMSGMIYSLKNELGNKNELVEIVKDINNVRPISKAMMWLEWKGSVNRKYRNLILFALKKSLSEVLSTDLAKAWDNIATDLLFTSSGDLTDKLSQLSQLIEDVDFDNMQRLVSAFQCFSNLYRKIIPEVDAHLKGAESELTCRLNKDKQYIFMGHTHEAVQAYFTADNYNSLKMYINTGTYLPLIQMTMDEKSFALAQQMTMALVYGKSEAGPALEIWNGIRI